MFSASSKLRSHLRDWTSGVRWTTTTKNRCSFDVLYKHQKEKHKDCCENIIYATNHKLRKNKKQLEMYCICYTKKIEIRDQIGLPMRARNLKGRKQYISRFRRTLKIIRWSLDLIYRCQKKLHQQNERQLRKINWICIVLSVGNQRKCRKRVQHGENEMCVKKCKNLQAK